MNVDLLVEVVSVCMNIRKGQVRSNRLKRMLTLLGIFLEIIVAAHESKDVELMNNGYVIDKKYINKLILTNGASLRRQMFAGAACLM